MSNPLFRIHYASTSWVALLVYHFIVCVHASSVPYTPSSDSVLIQGVEGVNDRNEFYNAQTEQGRIPRSVPSPSLQECGEIKVPLARNYQDDVVNLRRGLLARREAQIGEIPWAVAIMMKRQGRTFYCGGALIDHLHVVTSAACVSKLTPDEVSTLKIRLGDHNLYDPMDTAHVEQGVERVAYHKDYDPDTFQHNIALVRMEHAVNFSDIIQPVCLPDNVQTYDKGSTLGVVAGWGQITQVPLESLSKLNVRLWSNHECSKRYKKRSSPEIVDEMLCAGTPVKPSKNLCRGNAGAPLTIRQKGQRVLIGVTSWGVGGETFPCVYTRIDKYLYWINKNRGAE